MPGSDRDGYHPSEVPRARFLLRPGDRTDSMTPASHHPALPRLARTLAKRACLVLAAWAALAGPAAAQDAGEPPKITSAPLPAVLQLGIRFDHLVTVTGSSPVAVTATGLPPGLSYDDTTRRITGAATSLGNYVVTLRATNGFPPPDAQVSPVAVINPPLTIITPPPLSATPLAIGVPVSITIQATGDQPIYGFFIVAGALPPGLTLTEAGTITGTPTAPGYFPFVVLVRDVIGRSDTREYDLQVGRIPTRIDYSLAPNPAVSGQVVVLRANVVPLAGPLPSGTLEGWAAGPDTRCPDPFETGPAPVTTVMRTATLAGGKAELGFDGLPVGAYRVCVRYGGGTSHEASTVGPLDLFVIKGILLPSPKLAVQSPGRVVAGEAYAGTVLVTGLDGAPLPGGRVRVRAGVADLGEADVVGGVARFNAVAPATVGAIALTASYAGGSGFGPGAAEPRWMQVVAKADGATAVPVMGPAGLALLVFLLAAGAARAFARRR